VAALWCLGGAAMSGLGLMHAHRYTPGDVVLDLAPAVPWALGYLGMALVYAVAGALTVPDDTRHG